MLVAITMYDIILACRPKQWIKNVLVFAALVFSQELFVLDALLHALGGFVLFTLVSSSVYLLNDTLDRKEDALHPEKKHRPIASGKVQPEHALLTFAICILLAIGGSIYWYSLAMLGTLSLYFVVNLVYSFWLKKIVIIDLMSVATGFVLRAIAGAVAINVVISPWLLAATFFAALFLILGKRRHELMNLGENTVKHRKVLGEYSKEMLDGMLIIVTTITVVMYVLYTMAETTIERFHTQNLIFTVVFVVYGIFRTFYLIYQRNEGGAPTEMLLKDRPLQLNILFWLITVIVLIY